MDTCRSYLGSRTKIVPRSLVERRTKKSEDFEVAQITSIRVPGSWHRNGLRYDGRSAGEAREPASNYARGDKEN